jgi:lipopolysaccharide exporter
LKATSSYWYRSAFYTLFEQFSVVLFGFGSVMILLRVLSKEEFGVWALFLTVAAFIEVARNGLIQNAFIKFLTSLQPDDPDYKSQYATISTASLAVNVLLTMISIALLFLFAGALSYLWRTPQLQYMLYFYAVSTTALIPFSQFNFLQQANFDFRGVFWANFARQGTFFALVVAAYFFSKNSLFSITLFHALAAIVGAFISYLFARKYIQLNRQIDFQWVKKLLHYGKFVFGTNMGAMLHKSIDKFMLGSILSTGAVALYDLATRINNLMEIPVSATASVVFPQSSRNNGSLGVGAVKELYEKSVAAVLTVLLPAIAFVVLFPDWVIWVIAGSKYADAVPLLRITALYGFFLPFARQFGTIFDSIGKPRLNFLFVIFGAGLNLIFNYFFIHRFGTMGAAYGTLSVFSITFVLNQIILYRELNISLLHTFRYIGRFYLQIPGKLETLYLKCLSMLQKKIHSTPDPKTTEP